MTHPYTDFNIPEITRATRGIYTSRRPGDPAYRSARQAFASQVEEARYQALVRRNEEKISGEWDKYLQRREREGFQTTVETPEPGAITALARMRAARTSERNKMLDQMLYPRSAADALAVARGLVSSDREKIVEGISRGGLGIELLIAPFKMVGGLQAVRDVLRDTKEHLTGGEPPPLWMTGLAALGAGTLRDVGKALGSAEKAGRVIGHIGPPPRKPIGDPAWLKYREDLMAEVQRSFAGLSPAEQEQKVVETLRAVGGPLVKKPTGPRLVEDTPDLDTPTFERRLDPGMRSAISESLKKHAGGGSTVDPRTGESVTSGYAVSPFKDREKVLQKAPSASDLRVFLVENKDLLEDPKNMLGTWFDKEAGKHVLDVVRIEPDLAKAARVGVNADQRAVFHLDSGTEYPVNPEALAAVGDVRTTFPGRQVKDLPADEVRSNFLRWARGSQVTEPVYHATKGRFQQFSKTEDIGFHFGTRGQAEARRKLRYSMMGQHLPGERNPYRIGEYFVRAENPLRVHDPGDWRPENIIENAANDRRIVEHLGIQPNLGSEVFPDASPGQISKQAYLVAVKDEIARRIEMANPPPSLHAITDLASYKGSYTFTGGAAYPEDEVKRYIEWAKTDKSKQFQALKKIIQDAGYDSLVYKNTGEVPPEARAAWLRGIEKKSPRPEPSLEEFVEDSYIVFDPEQIKSTKNVGAFDPKDPRFMHGLGIAVGGSAAAQAQEEGADAPFAALALGTAVAPSARQVSNVARRFGRLFNLGRAGSEFYPFITPATQEIFGEAAPFMSDALAATSANTPWITPTMGGSNITKARQALREYLEGKPFGTYGSYGVAHPNIVANLERAAAGEPLTGPKIGPFSENLRGNLMPVTVDRWMARAGGFPTEGEVSAPVRRTIEEAVYAGAPDVDLPPANYQAGVWSGAIRQAGRAPQFLPPGVTEAPASVIPHLVEEAGGLDPWLGQPRSFRPNWAQSDLFSRARGQTYRSVFP